MSTFALALLTTPPWTWLLLLILVGLDLIEQAVAWVQRQILAANAAL